MLKSKLFALLLSMLLIGGIVAPADVSAAAPTTQRHVHKGGKKGKRKHKKKHHKKHHKKKASNKAAKKAAKKN